MKLIISVLFLATGAHCGLVMNTKARPVRSSTRAASPCLSIRVAGASAGCATLLLGWAFQGVGPSPEAKAAMDKAPPTKVGGLRSALLFGGATPTVALYCGAKVRPESYAPLALAISEKLEAAGGSGGVLVLQSPFNVYAFKPATVAKVLDAYPSITCVAGHSIGGLWAAELCRDLHEAGAWPGKGLDFSLWGPLLGQMPSFAGALFGRSLFSGCKCEACVYSIDTMVMYLDEDTMGMFDEADIDRILMDRFCYGIKWMCETGRVSDIAPRTRSHPAHPAPPLGSGTARRATTSCRTTTRT